MYTAYEPAALEVSPIKSVARSLSPPLLDCGGEVQGTPTSALLHHFQQNWRAIFALPNAGNVLGLCHGRPYLYNTVLAVAACHLRHHSPNPSRHQQAEHFRQYLALRDFQGALSPPIGTLGPNEVGPVILGAVLLNLITFVLPADEDPAPAATAGTVADLSMSWVFSERTNRLDWLAVQFGLKPLLMETRLSRRGISLGPIFDTADDQRGAFSKGGLGPDHRVPDVWLPAFGLPPDQPCQDNQGESQCPSPPKRMQDWSAEEMNQFLFETPLRALAVIRNVEPVEANIYVYLQFAGTLEPEFRLRLYERDEKALWTFGYWLGLMCRFEYIWWCGRRVRRDFTAIVIWLRGCGVTARPGEEGLLWRAMIEDLEDSVSWPPGSAAPPGQWDTEILKAEGGGSMCHE